MFKNDSVRVIFKIEGGKDLKYEFGDAIVFDTILRKANEIKMTDNLEIKTLDDFENPKDIIGELANSNKGFSTYVAVNLYIPQGEDRNDLDLLRRLLKETNLGYIDIIDKTYNTQYLALRNEFIGTSPGIGEFSNDTEPYSEKDYAKHKPLKPRKKLPFISLLGLYLPKGLELPPYTRSPKGTKLMQTILKAIDEGVAVFHFAGLENEDAELHTTNKVDQENMFAYVLLKYLSLEPVFDFSKHYQDIVMEMAAAIKNSPVIYLYSDDRKDYPDSSIHTIIYTARESE